MIERALEVHLPARQSAFLWGPRKTGKTTFLRRRFPDSVFFDLLDTDLQLEMVKEPSLLRSRLLARSEAELERPVIIDEVQKVPQVLDEVHWLIENRGLRFVLCGSSARKLKRGRGNLPGGRAWRHEMFPLVSAELDAVDLPRVLERGLVPAHYLGDGEVAVEVKGAALVHRRQLGSLSAFVEEHSPRMALLVSTEREERVHEGIRILPWRRFLEMLWGGEIVR